MKRNIQLIETEPEMTQMIDSLDKDIKTVILTIFHMFKKVGEGLNMVSGDTTDIKKDPNWTSRAKKKYCLK